jgi:hypothetical protein
MDRKSTHDAKRTGNGIESDHAAISLKFKLDQSTEKQKPKAKNNSINWRQLFRDDRIKELFTKMVDKKLKELKQSENENDDEDIIQISELNEIIMEIAKIF